MIENSIFRYWRPVMWFISWYYRREWNKKRGRLNEDGSPYSNNQFMDYLKAYYETEDSIKKLFFRNSPALLAMPIRKGK